MTVNIPVSSRASPIPQLREKQENHYNNFYDLHHEIVSEKIAVWQDESSDEIYYDGQSCLYSVANVSSSSFEKNCKKNASNRPTVLILANILVCMSLKKEERCINEAGDIIYYLYRKKLFYSHGSLRRHLVAINQVNRGRLYYLTVTTDSKCGTVYSNNNIIQKHKIRNEMNSIGLTTKSSNRSTFTGDISFNLHCDIPRKRIRTVQQSTVQHSVYMQGYIYSDPPPKLLQNFHPTFMQLRELNKARLPRALRVLGDYRKVPRLINPEQDVDHNCFISLLLRGILPSIEERVLFIT
ncbi:hypothetical protein WN51_06524 [Melipona quadrifasciata]|uniref:Uncharacterized protein n=1 Tax=Melipona quadrifasciata TaxID=166423 RepID=A0A0M8ZQH5_9HYME|nr:hypothetical protein WN51_06524 [Melipona quadrifasciata]